MTADDRLAMLAAQDAWASGKAYRPPAHEDSRTRQAEIRTAHQGQPSIAEQDRTHGAGIPAEDRGPNPRGGAR